MQLYELRAPGGSRKRRKIVGRGSGSGHGKTCGRGQKGQNARSGRGILNTLEGGQMPLIRRIPKVGFRSKRPVLYQLVKLASLERFKEGTVIDGKLLKAQGLIHRLAQPFKILADGEISKPFIIEAHGVSKSAREKILKAGGQIKMIKRGGEKDFRTKK